MIEKKTGSCKILELYRGHGGDGRRRSAAGTQNTVLHISRAWRNGRRTALRMLWIKIHGGSNPPARTKIQNSKFKVYMMCRTATHHLHSFPCHCAVQRGNPVNYAVANATPHLHFAL